jgi:hypothetical protein
MAKRNGNGTDFFEERLRQFGVPDIIVPKLKIPKSHKKILRAFLRGENNLVVIGSSFYSICVKLMRLRFLNHIHLSMLWLSQSSIDFNTVQILSTDRPDAIALVNLYKPDSPHKKDLIGAFVNRSLRKQIRLLIGANSPTELEEAFPYDLDSIENNFDIWKVE